MQLLQCLRNDLSTYSSSLENRDCKILDHFKSKDKKIDQVSQLMTLKLNSYDKPDWNTTWINLTICFTPKHWGVFSFHLEGSFQLSQRKKDLMVLQRKEENYHIGLLFMTFLKNMKETKEKKWNLRLRGNIIFYLWHCWWSSGIMMKMMVQMISK